MTTNHRPDELDMIFEALANRRRQEIVHVSACRPCSIRQLAGDRHGTARHGTGAGNLATPPCDNAGMSTRTSDASQHMLHIATLVAKYGFAVIPVGYGACSVPGCCAPAARYPWAYTVGLVERGQPEVVMLGGCPHAALRAINWVANEAMAGIALQMPSGTTMTLEGVGIKLIDVPGEWLAADLSRMAMWLNHYAPGRREIRLPAIRQLLWSDADGRFPDHPLCDPGVTADQPILANAPLRYPTRAKAPRLTPARARPKRYRPPG
jgi:Domain of unknown function (DUF4262)